VLRPDRHVLQRGGRRAPTPLANHAVDPSPHFITDLVPLEGLSFRDLRKPLSTTHFGVSVENFTFEDDISLLKMIFHF